MKKSKDLQLHGIICVKQYEDLAALWEKREASTKNWLKFLNKMNNNDLKLLILVWGKLMYNEKARIRFFKYWTSETKMCEEGERFLRKMRNIVYNEYLTRCYNLKKSNVSKKELKKHKAFLKKKRIKYFFLLERFKFAALMLYLYSYGNFFWKKETVFSFYKKRNKWEIIKNYIYTEVGPITLLLEIWEEASLYAYVKKHRLHWDANKPLDQATLDYFVVNRYRDLKAFFLVIKLEIISFIKRNGGDWLLNKIRTFYFKKLYFYSVWHGRYINIVTLTIGALSRHLCVYLIYNLFRALYFFRVINTHSIVLKYFKNYSDTKAYRLPKYRFSIYLVMACFWILFKPIAQICWALVWSSVLLHNLMFYQLWGSLYLYLGIQVNPLFFFLIAEWQVWLVWSFLWKEYYEYFGLGAWRKNPKMIFFKLEDLEFDPNEEILFMCGMGMGLFSIVYWSQDIYKVDSYLVKWSDEKTYEERLKTDKYRNIQVDMQMYGWRYLKYHTYDTIVNKFDIIVNNFGTAQVYGTVYDKNSLGLREGRRSALEDDDEYTSPYVGWDLLELSRRDIEYYSKKYHKHKHKPYKWKKYGEKWEELLIEEKIMPETSLVIRDYALEKQLLTEQQIYRLEHYLKYGDVEGRMEKPARANPKMAWIEKQRWNNMKWRSLDDPDYFEDDSMMYDTYIDKGYYDPADDDLNLHPIDQMIREGYEGSPAYYQGGKGAFELVYGTGYSDKVNVLYHPVLNPDVKTKWYYHSTSSYEDVITSLNYDEYILNILNTFLN